MALKVPGIRRNGQSHITDEHFRSDIPPQEDEIDGIAELCYDSMENLERSSGSPEAEALSPIPQMEPPIYDMAA